MTNYKYKIKNKDKKLKINQKIYNKMQIARTFIQILMKKQFKIRSFGDNSLSLEFLTHAQARQ